MKIKDLLKESSILLNTTSKSKQELLDEAINLMNTTGAISNIEEYRMAVYKREEEGTTGVGEGIAIPHAKSNAVKHPQLVAIVSKEGIDFSSLDNEPVNLLFLIAAPNSKDNIHLDVLSNLSVLLMDENFKNELLSCNSQKEFLEIVSRYENKDEEEVVLDTIDCVAVTACPTGIAHTYMAEEALKKAALKMKLNIKIETNGSAGVKNKLTDEDIKNAKFVIVAADTKVDMPRFDGKKVIIVKVADAIHKPEALLNKGLNEEVGVYKNTEKTNSSTDVKEGFWHLLYKHLMSGVSHMLPFVIGGGILIALAFLFDTIANAPQDSNFGQATGFSKFFKTTGGYAFGFMLPVLSAYIAYSIADRPGLLVGFVGGFMANQSEFSIYISEQGSVSGFLGALVAGFAAGYIIVLLKLVFKKLPKAMDGLKPTLFYPIFGLLLIAFVMYFIVNPPFSLLNNLINHGLANLGETNQIILGFILAAMMAIDMGGPINKAAYVFGTATLTTMQSSPFMASVMIGGMVPPLAIALCTTLFPQKFSKKERQDGKSNYVMGLSFITEGAIPFAASDPWRVILSCSVGSGIAGLLSAALGCTLPAPHGGIFVVAVISNWYWYLLALAVGSFVGALLLGILKNNVDNPELGKFKGIRIFDRKNKKNNENNEKNA